MNSLVVQGEWSDVQKEWHINLLEMEAVFLVMKHFVQNLRDHNVLIRCDNSTVVQYINQQGALGHTSYVNKTWGHVELGHSKQYSDESGPYSRQGQCTSRQIEQTQNSSHRMDSEQNGCSSDISEVGVSNSRPVCITHEQADRGVLLMDDRFQGSSNRRSVNSMARHVRVCLSPPLSHSESATTRLDSSAR